MMTSCAELTDYEWLTGSEAGRLLTELAEETKPLHTAAERLRRRFSPARTHLLLEQVELRRRAAVKFDRATEMFFMRLGLEQATDQWVAAYKAVRFAGREPTADLCCGIGGDLLGLAALGPTEGVDRDPIAVCLATANAQVLGTTAKLRRSEIADFNACGLAAWHIDPDRRPAGSRTTSLEWSSPSRDVVERLLAAAPNAAVKLAPAAEVPADWSCRCELEWISRDRECRQQVAWHGALAQSPGCRRATVLSADGKCLRTVVGQPDERFPIAAVPDRFLFEPDPAVLAASLAGVLAAEHGLSALSAGVTYLTGPTAVDDPALACFAVDDILPFDVRRVGAHLRERRIGQLEIKKRGVDDDPEMVRKQLRLDGDQSATLLLTELNRKRVAIVARRVHSMGKAVHAACV